MTNLFNLNVNILALGKPQAVISKETAAEMEANQEDSKETPRLRTSASKRDKFPKSLSAADGNNTSNNKLITIISFNSVTHFFYVHNFNLVHFQGKWQCIECIVEEMTIYIEAKNQIPTLQMV